MTHDADSSTPPRFWRSRHALGLVVMAAVAAVFLLSEHRAHFLGALPFLLVLACPLMHLFMHHGHGRHHDVNAGRRDRAAPPPPEAGVRGPEPGDRA